MTHLSDAEVAEILDELGGSQDWADSLGLEHLVCVAQRLGHLAGVQIHQLLADSRRDDKFLLAVSVTQDVEIASGPVWWRDIAPLDPATEVAAIRHLLYRLDGLVVEARRGFETAAVQRISSM